LDPPAGSAAAYDLSRTPRGQVHPRELRSELPECRVLIVTTFGRSGYLRRALAAGAAGFLLKDAPASDLAAAIRRVHAGERVVDPGLAAAALSEGDNPLTASEQDVLAAARAHATVAEIAGALFFSPGTVRNYLSSACRSWGSRRGARRSRSRTRAAGSQRRADDADAQTAAAAVSASRMPALTASGAPVPSTRSSRARSS
jgi:DNA-binding NarL/FixJ family response regulator